ncbi:MAG: bifunctional DNA-formamidopyrimidine glycosylase/DNA-(apurinic or apyrimidinic site) lyase [Deltaproteobacteria bacterium]|nr:bifunctional DNA-formamidopyrimidine glycosylase/DNA-(apurinic or apyrimidinic site) lyase [Deltaproteobacteria bacterium]
MPELPELETLCDQLRQVVLGAEILETQALDSNLINVTGLEGRTVRSVNRRGKQLEIQLDDGRILLLHLRMTGRLLWQNGDGLPPQYARFVVSFPKGRIFLIDPRRFATLSVRKEDRSPFEGSDLLEDFDPSHLWGISQKSRLPVKSFLMDQRHIAGVGNIYACEILHQAHISPWRKACDLSLAEWEKIGGITGTILKKAIACRGTTISDWHDLFGREGEYQNHLLVYGRGGEGCFECGGEIQRQKLNGRGTYFCPSCQK